MAIKLLISNYIKEDRIIVDISFRKDQDGIDEIFNFINSYGAHSLDYQINETGPITTILLNFKRDEAKDSELFIESFYSSIEDI